MPKNAAEAMTTMREIVPNSPRTREIPPAKADQIAATTRNPAIDTATCASERARNRRYRGRYSAIMYKVTPRNTSRPIKRATPLAASDDPEALAQLLRVCRFGGPGDRGFDERKSHQDRDEIQAGAYEQGEPQVVQCLDEETSREGARGVRQELDHRVPADVPGELGFVLRRQQGLIEVRGGPDRERGPEGPDHVRDDESREGRGQTVSEDPSGAKHLAQDNRPLASGPIRDHADGKLEDQKTDPERDVDEGELEVGAQVPADPKGPEWDPYRERRRCLVRVEPTDLCDDLARQHAFAGTETRQNISSYGRPPPRSVALWKRKGRRPEP